MLLKNNDSQRFNNWMRQYVRNYRSVSEYTFRFNQWLRADVDITQGNAIKGHTFTLGHNTFSDWTKEEYLAILLPFDAVDAPRAQPTQGKGGARKLIGDPCDPKGMTCGICATNDYAPVYNKLLTDG